MTSIVVLAWRELLRFGRQPTRLFGSLAQPLLIWFFLGSGFARSFQGQTEGLSYGEFFYPGIVVMLLLFAAIFSTITLIEDRTAGFLQGVLVAPVLRVNLVLGKLVGGTAIAFIQAGVFLLFAPWAGFSLGFDQVLGLVALFAVVGLGFTGLGFIVAWVMETVAGYHAIMSVVLLPMWLLSGALFPLEGAASWLAWVMRCNPTTYAMNVVRSAFYQPLPDLLADEAFITSLIATVAWTTLTIAGSVLIVVKKSDV